MGLERLEFGIRVWKFMVISVKTCYRSIRNHPFLIGFVCFIIYLYRSFPFTFSILVTASPVLVSTAILLGLLLIFGSPNIPEIEEKKEEKVSPLKTGATKDDFSVKRRVGKRKSIVENDYENVSLVDNEDSEVEENDGSVSYNMLVDERFDSMSIYRANRMVDGVRGTSNDLLLEKKREIQGEVPGSKGEHVEDRVWAGEVPDRNLEVDSNKFVADFSNVPDHEYLDSSSDGAESYSHDATIANVIPVLDELHPLLGSGSSQPALLSFDCSNDASERSRCSSNDEEEDDDEGKGAKTDNEDESKSAIKWTENDQKNLIDLGTSELKRDQRLETLIAMRMACKRTRSFTKKNLIDLGGSVISSHIRPISTARQNPFQLPYDSCHELGLPPIPGSAPCISRPRNPFDLPWDSSEEKPYTKGHGFHEGFSGFSQRDTLPQRESIFRRHGRFKVGPSSFGVPRQELNWKPYFVPEQLVTEGASLKRHSSDASESKMSSVPDTESVSSVLDEDYKPNGHDAYRQNQLIVNEQESQLSGDVESINVVLAEDRCVHPDVLEIILGDGESQLEMTSNLSEAAATAHMEFNASEIHSRRELATEYSSSNSSSLSSSSSSETDEEISDVKEEYFASFEPTDRETEESGFYTQASFEESEFHSTSRVVDDDQHREPVYDSSPPSLEKFFSFKSVSSNTLAEISEMSLPFMLAESTGARLKGRGETTEQSTTSFEEMHPAYSDLFNENKPRATDMPENSRHDVKYVGSPRGSPSSSDHNVVEYLSTDAASPSSVEGLEKDVPLLQNNLIEGSFMPKEEITNTECDQMHSPNSVASPDVDRNHYKNEELSSTGLNCGIIAEETSSQSSYQDVPHMGGSSPESDKQLLWHDTDMDEHDKLEGIGSSERLHVAYSECAFLPEDMKTKKNGMLPVLEARSAEDIDLAFKQLNEGVDVEELIVPSMIKKPRDHEENKSNLPVVEARTLEDIHKAFEQLPESNLAELPHSSGSRNEASKDTKTETNAVLPVLEARSAEDIDLAFKQLHEGVSVEEVIVPSMIEKPQDNADNKSKLPVVEARSLEDIHRAFQQVPVSNQAGLSHSLGLRNESLEEMKPEINVVLPVLEARSAEDIDLAFKQLHEGVSVEDVIVPSMIEKPQDHADYKSKLPVVEARSLEDIHRAFQQAPESNQDELSHSSSLRNESSKDEKTETKVVLPVLEARSAEDIDLAFKQLHEGVSVEEVIVPSMIEKSQDHADNKSQLPVVEARSLEDIHRALQQNLESNQAERPHSSSLRNASSEDSKTETNVVLPVLEARSAEDIDLAFKQLHEGVDVEEVILPSMFEKQQDHGDIKSISPVVKARSLEDIHKAFEQVPKSNPSLLPQSSGVKNELSKEMKTKTNAVLPVLEARTAEDIDLAFKQLHEGVSVEEVIVPSMIEKLQDHADNKSKLPVVEARSLEDLHNAFQQEPGSNGAKLPHSSGVSNESSSTVDWHEMVSAKENEVSDGKSASGSESEYEEASEF